MIRKNLFQKGIDCDSTRAGFGRGLVELGKVNDNVWALTADLAGSTCMSGFMNTFPERFVQVGVAEQNLVTVASGIASMGKTVFASSFAAFAPGRCWEQIRTTICYNNQPVVVVGSHTGLGVGEDGATHQMLEDISLMRVLPNMVVVVPCDAIQSEKATLALAKNNAPAYLRVARQKAPTMTLASTSFKLGEAQVFVEGSDLVIFACGPIIFEALLAANELKKKKISVAVINVHTIKPLDNKTIIKYAKKCGAFITLEDHQVAGGLGSVVSECLSRNYPVLGEFIGMNDEFGESGPADELFWKYGLTSDRIITKALKLLSKKNNSNMILPKKTVSKRTKVKKTISKKAVVLKKVAAKKVSSKKVGLKKVVKKTTSKNVAPKKITSKNNLAKKTASKKVIKKVAPKKVASKKDSNKIVKKSKFKK
ncbi:MAG: transketolase C-terminal domain-containing protein [Candidatus Woesearchaeota archaeon]